MSKYKYTPTTWIGGKTIGTADVMNNIEDGIVKSHEGLESVSSQLEHIENNVKSISVKDFGAKGDGIVDDTKAIQDAINYAFENNIYNVYIPPGIYITSKPIVLKGVSNHNGAVCLYGSTREISKIIKITNNTLNDGSVIQDLDAVIIIDNYDLSDRNQTINQQVYDIGIEGSGEVIVEYGIVSIISCAYQTYKRILMRNVNHGIQFKKDLWQSVFEDLIIISKIKGFSMLASGTSNTLNKIHVMGNRDIGYELRGNYSTANSIVAEWGADEVGIAYQISYGSWTLNSPGEENYNKAKDIMSLSNCEVVVNSPMFFGTTYSDGVIFNVKNNAKLFVNGGAIGNNRNVDGKLYNLALNSNIYINGTNIKDKYKQKTQTENINTNSSATIQTLNSTPINMRIGTRQAYIGIDRVNSNKVDNYLQTPTVGGKAIFLNCGSNPSIDGDTGENLRWQPPYSLGDIILKADPNDNGIIGFVCSYSGSDIGSCKFKEIVSYERGTSSNRPTTGMYSGRMYFDTTIMKPIYWNDLKWVDSMGNDV